MAEKSNSAVSKKQKLEQKPEITVIKTPDETKTVEKPNSAVSKKRKLEQEPEITAIKTSDETNTLEKPTSTVMKKRKHEQEPEITVIKTIEETKTLEKPNSAVSKKIERIASTSVPKGKCKSGRFWKSERDRFRSTIKSRGLKQSLQQRIRAKEEKEKGRLLLQRLKDDQKRAIDEKKARREENAKRPEVVQLIKNPNKIKRMKKKQLRMIA